MSVTTRSRSYGRSTHRQDLERIVIQGGKYTRKQLNDMKRSMFTDHYQLQLESAFWEVVKEQEKLKAENPPPPDNDPRPEFVVQLSDYKPRHSRSRSHPKIVREQWTIRANSEEEAREWAMAKRVKHKRDLYSCIKSPRQIDKERKASGKSDGSLIGIILGLIWFPLSLFTFAYVGVKMTEPTPQVTYSR